MGRHLYEFDILSNSLVISNLEIETREINTQKNIIVSKEDLQTKHRLNKNQKIAFQAIIVQKKGGRFFF